MGETGDSGHNPGLDGSAKNAISPANHRGTLNRPPRLHIRADSGRFFSRRPVPFQNRWFIQYSSSFVFSTCHFRRGGRNSSLGGFDRKSPRSIALSPLFTSRKQDPVPSHIFRSPFPAIDISILFATTPAWSSPY